MYTLLYTNHCTKALKRLKQGNRSVFEKVSPLLKRLLQGPPFESSYNVHQLRGKYATFHSINVTGDRRLIFSLNQTTKTITLHDLGTHSQLYS